MSNDSRGRRPGFPRSKARPTSPGSLARKTTGALPAPGKSDLGWGLGPNRETAELAAGLILLVIAFAGQAGTRGFYHLTLGGGADDPVPPRDGAVQQLRRPDGSVLHVELLRPARRPADRPDARLGGQQHRVVLRQEAPRRPVPPDRLGPARAGALRGSRRTTTTAWRSSPADLDAVLALAGDRPAVLVGHSIGGMITADLLPALPRGRWDAGSPGWSSRTRPTPTRSGRPRTRRFTRRLEKPVLVPLLSPDDRALAARLADELAELPERLGAPVHAPRVVRRHRDAAASSISPPASCPTPAPTSSPAGCSACSITTPPRYFRSIGVPTLVVAGDLDTTTVPEASRGWIGICPGASCVTLTPARHMGLIEHHERFDQLIGDFAGSCLSLGEAGRSAD